MLYSLFSCLETCYLSSLWHIHTHKLACIILWNNLSRSTSPGYPGAHTSGFPFAIKILILHYWLHDIKQTIWPSRVQAQWSASTLYCCPAPFLTFCFSKTGGQKIVHFDLFHSWTRPAHAALIFSHSFFGEAALPLSFVGGRGGQYFPRGLVRSCGFFLLIPLTGQITLMIFTVKPALHIWNRSHLVVVCNLFYALLEFALLNVLLRVLYQNSWEMNL